MRAFPLLAFALALTSPAARAPAQEPVSLAELAEIARARFERLRPEQLEALKPYLDDLELSYTAQNREYLERRFASAAQLGDAIVPALIEKLTPAAGGIAARNVAENSARILEQMDPSGFVDALVDVVQGSDETARQLAIELLGHSSSPTAAAVLTRSLGELPPTQLRVAVDALARLGATGAAPTIVTYLASQNQRLRHAALGYLAETQPPEVLPTVLEALRAPQSPEDLELFVRYLEGAAPRDERAAAVLVPMMAPSTDRQQLELVSDALATVAPEGHEPAIEACRRILALEETGSLGRSCARTMAALGDKSGLEMLLSNLRLRINREPRNELHYVDRAEVFRELGRWQAAVRDYEEAIDHSSNRRLKSNLYLRIALCEAHRNRWSSVLEALRDSGASSAEIRLAAAEDEELAKALERRRIQSYLESLEADERGGRRRR